MSVASSCGAAPPLCNAASPHLHTSASPPATSTSPLPLLTASDAPFAPQNSVSPAADAWQRASVAVLGGRHGAPLAPSPQPLEPAGSEGGRSNRGGWGLEPIAEEADRELCAAVASLAGGKNQQHRIDEFGYVCRFLTIFDYFLTFMSVGF